MAVFNKIDWKSVFLEMARESRARADRVADPKLKETWKSVAIRWERLSQAQPENCFCRRPAIGVRVHAGGEKIPYCGEHLAEAIHDGIG
jgi:hypothetical protein